MTGPCRIIWGWSEDGRRCRIAVPFHIAIDPPLQPGEVEIDTRDIIIPPRALTAAERAALDDMTGGEP